MVSNNTFKGEENMKTDDAIKQVKFPLYHFATDTIINTWDDAFEFFEVDAEDMVMDIHPFYRDDKFVTCIIVGTSMDIYFYTDDDESSNYAKIDPNK